MVEKHTFPQDGDNDSAANIGQLIGHPNLVDYTSSDVSVNVDYAVPNVTIGGGVHFVNEESSVVSSVGADDGETRLNVAHAVQIPQQTKSLVDNAINYVYVEPNLSTNDGGNYTVVQDTSNGPSDGFRIATIDTSSNSVTRHNRDASISAADVSINDNGTLTFGDDDDYTFEHDAGNDTLTLDSSNNELFVFGESSIDIGQDVDFNGNNLTDFGFGTPFNITDGPDTLATATGSGPLEFVNMGVQFGSGEQILDDNGDAMYGPSGGTNTLYINSSKNLRVYDEQAGNYLIEFISAATTSGHNTDIRTDTDIQGTLSVDTLDTLAGTGGIDVSPNLNLTGGVIDNVSELNNGGSTIDVPDKLNIQSNVEFNDNSLLNADMETPWSVQNSASTLVQVTGSGPVELLNGVDLQFGGAQSEVLDENGNTVYEPAGSNNTFYAYSGKNIRMYDNQSNSLFMDFISASSNSGLSIDVGADLSFGGSRTLSVNTVEPVSGDIHINNATMETPWEIENGSTTLLEISAGGPLQFRNGLDIELGIGTTIINEENNLFYDMSAGNNRFNVNANNDLHIYDQQAGGTIATIESGATVSDVQFSIDSPLTVWDNMTVAANLTIGPGNKLVTDEIGSQSGKIDILDDLDVSAANRFVLPHRTSDPSTGQSGIMWYRTDLD